MHDDVNWPNLIAHPRDEIVAGLLPFLADKTSAATLPAAAQHDGELGSVAGISLRVRRAGPPLVLMPLGLLPSQ